MPQVVLLRHGESTWNKENRFTGWTDVDLTDAGVLEARSAGRLLEQNGFTFDIAYTSVLTRAIRTLWLVLDETGLMWIPVRRSWRLNERHYGALQGLNKADVAKLHGEVQVRVWRRSFDVRPPPLDTVDERHPSHDARYRGLDPSELPVSECLKDTVERFLPYWHETIARAISSGNKALIVAHGNSLRALVKHLDHVSVEDIVDLNIPTGVPLVYELDTDLSALRHYYLGDPDAVQRAAERVANQGKAAP